MSLVVSIWRREEMCDALRWSLHHLRYWTSTPGKKIKRSQEIKFLPFVSSVVSRKSISHCAPLRLQSTSTGGRHRNRSCPWFLQDPIYWATVGWRNHHVHFRCPLYKHIPLPFDISFSVIEGDKETYFRTWSMPKFLAFKAVCSKLLKVCFLPKGQLPWMTERTIELKTYHFCNTQVVTTEHFPNAKHFVHTLLKAR